MSKLVKKVSQVFGHHTGGDEARAEASSGPGGSRQFTGIDPNRPIMAAISSGNLPRPGFRKRAILGAPSTPLGSSK